MGKKTKGMKTVACVTDGETCKRIKEFFTNEGVQFQLTPFVSVDDMHELWLNKADVEGAKELMEKVGITANITWRF